MMVTLPNFSLKVRNSEVIFTIGTLHTLNQCCGSALVSMWIQIQLFSSWRIRILVRLCRHKKYKILFEKDWSSGFLVNFLVSFLASGQ
jgi:hypothetical protein